MRVLHLPLVIFLFVCLVFAGNAQVGCGTDALRKELQNNPSYTKEEKQYRETTRIQAAALVQMPHVARRKPSVFQYCRGSFRLPVIAAHHVWSP